VIIFLIRINHRYLGHTGMHCRMTLEFVLVLQWEYSSEYFD